MKVDSRMLLLQLNEWTGKCSVLHLLLLLGERGDMPSCNSLNTKSISTHNTLYVLTWWQETPSPGNLVDLSDGHICQLWLKKMRHISYSTNFISAQISATTHQLCQLNSLPSSALSSSWDLTSPGNFMAKSSLMLITIICSQNFTLYSLITESHTTYWHDSKIFKYHRQNTNKIIKFIHFI